MLDTKMIDLRLAEPRDSLLLAEAAVAAGGGLYEHLLADAAAGVSIKSAVAAALSASADGLSWRNAIVADSANGAALGAAIAYPGRDFRLAPSIAAAAGAAAKRDLAPLFDARPPDDSYYLHAIWSRADGRGQGVGGLLLDAVIAIARDQGFSEVSLHVWRDNEAALRLYASRGFETIAEIPVDRRPRLPHSGGKLLMAAPA